MSFSLPAPLRSFLLRTLGVDDLQKRLAELEHRLATEALPQPSAEPQTPTSSDDVSLLQEALPLLKRSVEGITLLDRRIGSFRSFKFLCHLSEIYPKNKTVVFLGGNTFSDNAKYAYLAFSKIAADHGVTCTFLPSSQKQYDLLREAGVACLPYDPEEFSPQDIVLCLSTAILVQDNHFLPKNWKSGLPHALLSASKKIQLWHGIPIKEIGLELAPRAKIDDTFFSELMASCGPFDAFVATNETSRTAWRHKFGFNAFYPIGYPRNDVLMRPTTKPDTLNVDPKALEHIEREVQKKTPLVFYTPTFRDDKSVPWFENAGIPAFADACATKGWLFYVNIHPCDKDLVAPLSERYPRINFVAPETDIYPLVKHADLLITDYSSMAFDFLLVDKPIVFYRPDHHAYIENSRGLIDEHEAYICGEVVTTLADLVRTVEGIMPPNGDPHRETRHALRNSLFDDIDARASNRVCALILEMLDTLNLE